MKACIAVSEALHCSPCFHYSNPPLTVHFHYAHEDPGAINLWNTLSCCHQFVLSAYIHVLSFLLHCSVEELLFVHIFIYSFMFLSMFLLQCGFDPLFDNRSINSKIQINNQLSICCLFQSVVRSLWHPKLNQIMVGTGNGLAKVYYDPVKSQRYVIMIND